MEKLLQNCIERLKAGEVFALAILAESEGSTPRGAGAMMMVRVDGSISGSIGGGALEARAISAAAEVIRQGGSRLLPFDLSNADAAQSDMICGGSGLMIVVEAAPADLPVFSAALDAAKTGGGGFLIVDCPQHEGIGRALSFSVSEEEGAAARYFLPIQVGGRLLLFGAGHVSREIAALAAHLGFRVTVMDDRAEFADVRRFPGCEVRVLENMNRPPSMTLNQDDYVVVATRGHLHDLGCLEWALHSGAGYIGMIGSRRKKGLVFAEMEARGIPQAALERVSTPVGLEIKAQTPAEIAVSIAAELIERRAGQRGT